MSEAVGALEAIASGDFPQWLIEQRISLAISAYRSPRMLLIGVGQEGRLSICERTVDRCMGIWSDGQTIWLATAYQLWRFESVPTTGLAKEACDRLFAPRVAYVTGDIDVHDLGVAGDGQVYFVSSLFNCIGKLNDQHNIEVVWRPPFISRVAPEDRCHLNGLAIVDGRPRYVSVAGPSDIADGWRDHRRSGGCVIDIESNRVVVSGLSMPHSPRWHDNRLWLLDSGSGHFGFVDFNREAFERIAFCPGYSRGLALIGKYAIIGLSKGRTDPTFDGLELHDLLKAKGAVPRCGLLIVDLESGATTHWLRFEGPIAELYDIALLPKIIRPKALGFVTDEIRRHVAVIDGDNVTHWCARAKL